MLRAIPSLARRRLPTLASRAHQSRNVSFNQRRFASQRSTTATIDTSQHEAPSSPLPSPTEAHITSPIPSNEDDITTPNPDVVALAASTPGLSLLGVHAATLMCALHSTGLSWSSTLIASAILVRTTTAPLLYLHQLHSARAAAASRDLARAQQWVRRAPGTLLQRYTSWRQLRAVALRSAGTSSIAQMPWFFVVHIPLIAASSLGARVLADTRADEWANAGPPWAVDLAAADPTGALPAIAAALWLWNANGAGSAARAAREAAARKVDAPTRDAQSADKPTGDAQSADKSRDADTLSRALASRSGEWAATGAQALTLVMFPYILHVPAGVALLWTANGVLTALQRAALRSSSARRLIGLPTAADVEEAAKQGPQVLKATAAAMRGAREQVEYVERDILPRFARRSVDKGLADDVNRALEREVAAGRISIRLVAEVRVEKGAKYLAVVPESKGRRARGH